MNCINTLRQIALPPLAEIIAQLNEGDNEYAVIKIGNYYEFIMFVCGDEIIKEPHHDIQSAMFAMAQSLVTEYAGLHDCKTTRQRIKKSFKPSYFVPKE